MQAVQATASTVLHQGPLPHPETLAQYDAVSPGAAQIIINMALAEADHRRACERLANEAEVASLRAEDRDSRLGLWLAFIVAMTVIGGSIASILNGQQVGGSILGGVAVTGLVGAFIAAGRQRNKSK